MNGVEVVFDDNYLKNSKQVKDQRVFRVVERKFQFLKVVGLNYPSLNAKPLNNVFYEGVEVWEFYISKKWRCLFTYDQSQRFIRVLKISNHL